MEVQFTILISLASAQDSTSKHPTTKLDNGIARANGMASVFVRMDDQLLGEAGDYERFCDAQPKTAQRLELREQVMTTLRQKADASYEQVSETVQRLVAAGQVGQVQRHWIVNGFDCRADAEACRTLAALEPVGFIYRHRIADTERESQTG